MYLTLDECAVAWEKAGGHGTKEARITRNARWIPFYSYVAGGQQGNTSGPEPHAKEVARILQDAGVLQEGDSLLDMGCGTGGFSLAFAELGAQVTAMDMDAASLSVLQNRAKANGLTNIQTEEAMWEYYAPQKQFDVVFSSMCPAICDHGELLRFENMAKKYGCLIAVSRGSYDKHRKQLMQELKAMPTGGMTTEAMWYYNMLYLMGRQPNVWNFTRHYEYEAPVEKLVEQNKVYFEIFGIPQEESEPKLRAYYKRYAVGGMIADESHLNTQLIWWKIPEK